MGRTGFTRSNTTAPDARCAQWKAVGLFSKGSLREDRPVGRGMMRGSTLKYPIASNCRGVLRTTRLHARRVPDPAAPDRYTPPPRTLLRLVRIHRSPRGRCSRRPPIRNSRGKMCVRLAQPDTIAFIDEHDTGRPRATSRTVARMLAVTSPNFQLYATAIGLNLSR
jgi:hypothetical protein